MPEPKWPEDKVRGRARLLSTRRLIIGGCREDLALGRAILKTVTSLRRKS